MASTDVKITLSAKDEASAVLGRVSTSAESLGGTLAGVGKAAAAAAAVVTTAAAALGTKLAFSAITGASSLEQQKVAFKTLLGSAEEADAAISQIIEDAKTTPFELPGLIKGNQLLIAAGVSAEDARVDFLDLGNAVSAVGGGQAELDRLAVNLQQIKATGQAATLDIKQFAFAGIPIYGLLADSMGVAENQVKGLVEAGKVGYGEVTTALENAAGAGGRFEGALETQSKTFAGVMSNIKDTFSVTLTQIANDSGLFDSVKKAAESVLDIFNKNKDSIITFGNTIASFIGEHLVNLIDRIINVVQNFDSLKEQFKDTIQEFEKNTGIISMVKDEFLKVYSAIVDKLIPAIEENKEFYIALAKVVGVTLVAAFYLIMEVIENVITFIANLNKGISSVIDFFGGLSESIVNAGKYTQEFVNHIANMVTNVISYVSQLPEKFIELGQSIINGLINGIDNSTDAILESISNVGENIKNRFKEILGISSPSKVFSEFGINIISGLTEGIDSSSPEINESLNNIKERITDFGDSFVVLKDKLKDAFSNFQSSVSESKNIFKTSIDEIKAKISEENLAFQEGNEDRKKSLKESIAEEIVSQQNKFNEIKSLIDEENSKGQEASADKVSQLQDELNLINGFLQSNAEERKRVSDEIAEIERFNALDPIQKLKERFQQERIEIKIAHDERIADLQSQLEKENEIKKSAIKDARVTLKKQYENIKNDTVELVDQMKNEFGGIPDLITEAFTSVAGKLSGIEIKVSGANTGGIVTSSGIQKFADGGVVPGVGNQDTVPAMLTPGEIVLNPKRGQGLMNIEVNFNNPTVRSDNDLNAIVRAVESTLTRNSQLQNIGI